MTLGEVGAKRLARGIDGAFCQVEHHLLSRMCPLLQELLFIVVDLRALAHVGMQALGCPMTEQMNGLVSAAQGALELTKAALDACTEAATDCRNFFLWLQHHMRR